MELQRVDYSDLSSKQREVYNFQKVASVLAEYGFNCIKLTDDWQGADFLAYHKDGVQTLRVQLKARLTINRDYLYKGLYLTFPAKGRWYLVPHDELVEIACQTTNWLNTRSWADRGSYNTANPSQKLLAMLVDFALETE